RQKNDSKETHREDMARHLIFSVLYQYAEIYAQQPFVHEAPSTRKEEIKTEFQQLVTKHCVRERKLPFYAAKLFISPKHLMETIKEETGKTAGEIIDEAVMLEAKLLLNDKHKTIQQ